MKKILAIIVLMAVMLSFNNESKAQVGSATRMAFEAQDTLNTSSSLDTVTKYIKSTAGASAFTIQLNLTKVSGTINAKAYLYGSLDGTNYTVTDSTAALADATQSVWFTKTSTPYTYYMVQVRNSTGNTTTQKVTVRTYYVFKRYD